MKYHKKMTTFNKIFIFLNIFLIFALNTGRELSAATQDRNVFSKRGEKNSLSSKDQAAITVNDPSLIKIPQEIGTVKEHFIGDSDFFIAHIQDAHCNYEAQMNIAKITKKLIKEYNLQLIGVEGSTGIIDTTPFATFPDQDIRLEVADYFVKKGKITGPEFLSITENLNFTIFGMETERYYNNNYKAFVKAIKFKDFATKYCSQIKNTLEKLKLKIFSPELIEIDNKNSLYAEQQIDFMEYSDHLEKWAKQYQVNYNKYKNFTNQIKIKKLEKEISFDDIEKEREKLVKQLLKKKGRKGVRDIIAKSLEFKLQKISPVDYYALLVKAINKSKLPPENYANLIQYLDYIKLFKKIVPSQLFVEVDNLGEDIKEKLYENKLQEELNRELKHIRILNNLFTLEVPKNEYLYYQKNKMLFTTDFFLNFIREYALSYSIPFSFDPEIKNIDRKINIIEGFYDIAIKRDAILVKNLLKQMAGEKKFAVLITGGFHSAGIIENLRKRNISYLVIAPKISKQDTDNPYISVMLEQQNYMK